MGQDNTCLVSLQRGVNGKELGIMLAHGRIVWCICLLLLLFYLHQGCWRRNLKIHSAVQLISSLLSLPLLSSFSSGETVTSHIYHNSLVSCSNTIAGPCDLCNQVQTLRTQIHMQSVPTQVWHPDYTHSHASNPLYTCHSPS